MPPAAPACCGPRTAVSVDESWQAPRRSGGQACPRARRNDALAGTDPLIGTAAHARTGPARPESVLHPATAPLPCERFLSARSPCSCSRTVRCLALRGNRHLAGPIPGLTNPRLGLGDGPGRVHQPDVAEGLGEVAEQLTRRGIDLLGEQADVVDVADGALEDLPGSVDAVRQGQRLGEPERAEQEGALLPGETVHAGLGAVPVDKTTVVGEP